MARILRHAGITGLGMYVPEQILTNHDLERMVETSDEWIIARTGIRERRIAADSEATSDLAAFAARAALDHAGLAAGQIDLILVATSTGDFGTFPATACIVQDKLGAKGCAAFDVAAVCSGFAYALDVAAQYIATGRYDNILVIGAEAMSRVVDWTDRGTCILFGDGAGAVVVQPVPEGQGILGSVLGADGSGACLQNIPAGGSRLPVTVELVAERRHLMQMQGAAVYRFAVEMMGEVALQALRSVDQKPGDVDLFIPHQANIRIITSAAQRLNLPMGKVFVNLEKYGNTSAASIPLALYEAWQSGRIQPGSLIVTVGFGAGLTWGANVIRWGDLVP